MLYLTADAGRAYACQVQRIGAFYRRHIVGGPVGTALLLWGVIERILDWAGLIDEARAMMNPDHWLTKVILWPNFGLVTSVSGTVLLLLLFNNDKSAGKADAPNRDALGPPTLPTPILTTPTTAATPSESARSDKSLANPDAPIAATLPTPVIASTPTGATSSAKVRVFVDVAVTPEYLTGLFRQHLNIQAKKLIQVYVGKWIKVSGPLGDVYQRQVTFAHKTYGGIAVYMYPSEGFIDRCSALLPGKYIEVVGEIRDVNAVELHLENCELVA